MFLTRNLDSIIYERQFLFLFYFLSSPPHEKFVGPIIKASRIFRKNFDQKIYKMPKTD